MTSRVPFSDRDKLELAFTKREIVWRELPSLNAILKPVWQGIVSILAPLDEPRIRQMNGIDGSPYFLTYDPVTGMRHRFDSEESLRVWLEQRYSK
ncbi:MAG: hypothetical protein AB4050_05630 [Synechococcus sp.]